MYTMYVIVVSLLGFESFHFYFCSDFAGTKFFWVLHRLIALGTNVLLATYKIRNVSWDSHLPVLRITSCLNACYSKTPNRDINTILENSRSKFAYNRRWRQTKPPSSNTEDRCIKAICCIHEETCSKCPGIDIFRGPHRSADTQVKYAESNAP